MYIFTNVYLFICDAKVTKIGQLEKMYVSKAQNTTENKSNIIARIFNAFCF